MSARTHLSPSEWKYFLSLADPQRDFPHHLSPANLGKILHAADVHGLQAIVLRKLTEATEWKARIPQEQAIHLDDLMRDAEISAGMTMMLDHYHRAIQAQLQRQQLRAVVVKGPVFARTIYRHPNDRPFTDIDLLSHPKDMDGVAQILTDLGFRRFSKGVWDRSDTYQEQKWLLSGNANVMIELHGNLVHYPSLRRGVSFGYEDYCVASQGVEDCPVALFMTAVVHASLGHKFHKLQLLVDLLQAFRHLSEVDLQRLEDVATSLSLRLEASLCLNLIAEIFVEPRAEVLAQRLALPVQSRLASSLVTPDALMKMQGKSRLQRHAFRWLQSLHWGR